MRERDRERERERDLALNMSRVAGSHKRNLNISRPLQYRSLNTIAHMSINYVNDTNTTCKKNMSASRPDAADWAPLNKIKNYILVCVKVQCGKSSS